MNAELLATEASPLYEGAYRFSKPPSCRLTYSDLRTLFRLLQEKAAEATAKVVARIEADNSQPEDERAASVEHLKGVLRVQASIEGKDGQHLVITDPDFLDEEKIGFPIRRVTFDSAVGLRIAANRNPDNSLVVRLDFDTPPLFDLSNPSSEPTANDSKVEVQ